jgi:glucose-6-phosphate isomerase
MFFTYSGSAVKASKNELARGGAEDSSRTWEACERLVTCVAFGKTSQEVQAENTPAWLVPHLTFKGNRPSNMILLEQLPPESLGTLVALYEHCVFT